MKFQSLIIAAFIGTVAANPVPVPIRIEVRQTESSNELVSGACKAVTLIYARGSTEAGNMGTVVGPALCADLKSTLGADVVACQGVGSPYTAALIDNLLPQNTSPQAIGAATSMFTLANTKCPNTKVIAGGYSQGAAVMDGSIQALPAKVMAQVKGVVLFGYTRNKQDGGRIPNYPTSQTKVFCADGDLVCNGTLVITQAHFSYDDDAPAAAAFLASKVK